MAKRKPLPYAAADCIDRAVMGVTVAKRNLIATIDEPMTNEERYRRLAQAVNHLHEALAALKEAKEIRPE